MRSIPRVEADSYERLIPIEGTPVDLLNPPEGCPFAPRCTQCTEQCRGEIPFRELRGGRVRCLHAV